MKTNSITTVARKLLNTTHPLVIGPNTYKSEFAKVVEGTLRRDYLTLLTTVYLAEHDVWLSMMGIWWYQKSRQFLGKNKTKLNCSRNRRLPFQIHLCWCVIVKRLMQALMIVKREIFTQVPHSI